MHTYNFVWDGHTVKIMFTLYIEEPLKFIAHALWAHFLVCAYKEFSGAYNIIGQLHSEGVHSVSYTLYATDKICNNSASYLYVPNCRVVKNCITCCKLIKSTQCLQTTYPGWAPWCGEWHLLLIHMSSHGKTCHISVAVVARRVLGRSVTSTLLAPSWQLSHQKVVFFFWS